MPRSPRSILSRLYPVSTFAQLLGVRVSKATQAASFDAPYPLFFSAVTNHLPISMFGGPRTPRYVYGDGSGRRGNPISDMDARSRRKK
jgi:hypothetical protein